MTNTKQEKTIGRMKPIELAKLLDEPIADDSYDVNESSTLLEEELWGLSNGVYTPIGRLSLPVIWKQIEAGTEEPADTGLITVFCNSFFENPDEFYALSMGESVGIELEDMLDHVKRAINKKDIPYIETKGKIESGYALLMNQHIPRFLQLYDETRDMPATTESLQCIKKCFTDYR